MNGCRFQEKSFNVYLNSPEFSQNYDIVFRRNNKMKRKLTRLIRIIKEDIQWYEIFRVSIRIIIIITIPIILLLIK